MMDPKDHQADPNFPPDKESSWKFPKEGDRWFLIHRAILTEVGSFKNALEIVAKREESAPLPQWTISSIQLYWNIHEEIVRDHCKREDDELYPFLSKRIKLIPGDHDVKKEHWELENQWDMIAKAVKDISSDNGANLKDLLKLWTDYESLLQPHFQEEEGNALILMRAFFSQDDMSQMTRKLMEEAPAEATGALIHNMGENRFRSEFMKHHGIPFFVWNLAFKKQLHVYKKHMLVHVEALVKGEPPKAETKQGWFG